MCCFSGPVRRVSDTRIFARSEGPRQLLAYEARVAADAALAMVLPIPAGDTPRFVDLSASPHLFARLDASFVPPTRGPRKSAPPPRNALEVVEVGAWEASWVPSRARFSDLDPRFRLGDPVLDALGDRYTDWGFAVFQLSDGDRRIHPLGLEFLRRDPRRLFFPTVHVHDGSVPGRASFDHVLFAQESRGERLTFDGAWEESERPLKLDDDDAPLLLDGRHVYRRTLLGDFPNSDWWI